MKKYFRAILCILYSSIKFSFIKMLNIRNFKFSYISIISPFTEISIERNAKLYLGKMVKMRSGVKIRVRKNAEVRIGRNTSLNHGCIFTAHEKIYIGEDVQFGPNVLIYDHDHDFKKKNGLKNLDYKVSPVEIGNNVWIGANVIILRGSKIGNNCVIGANSVIKGEYPNDSIIIQKKETSIIKYKNI